MNDAARSMTDEELVSKIREGDEELLGIIMERYEKKLLRYGRKFLSSRENIEDLVQETFIKTYQNLKSFDVKQKFSPWIYRIAHNTFINGMKKNSRSPIYLPDFDTLVSHPVYEDPSQAERERQEMRKVIDKGLDQLPSNYKEIIILYYMEELSYKEIADIVRIPIGTVGIRLRRAKDKLKKIYLNSNVEYGKQ